MIPVMRQFAVDLINRASVMVVQSPAQGISQHFFDETTAKITLLCEQNFLESRCPLECFSVRQCTR